jgi:hypothetical protein
MKTCVESHVTCRRGGPDEGVAADHRDEWREFEEAVALPRWDGATSSVLDRDTGAIIGSIRPMREGTPQEAISCYCRLHQCAPPLQRKHTAPTHDEFLEWFRFGQELGAGKIHRQEHLAKYKELVARKRASL